MSDSIMKTTGCVPEIFKQALSRYSELFDAPKQSSQVYQEDSNTSKDGLLKFGKCQEEKLVETVKILEKLTSSSDNLKMRNEVCSHINKYCMIPQARL
mmetsp:Transcript_863/g.1550  ORF Transcript_863/g.1550 Transcript_863/m.1550 type:complete len:98 (+) Transcript_863:1933-2226(+)